MILSRQKDLMKKKKILNFFSFFFALKLSESLCLIPSRYLLPLLMTSFFSKGNKNKKSLYFEFLKVTYIFISCPAHHQILKHLFPQTKAKSWAGNTVCKTCGHRSELGKAWFTFCLEKSKKKISQKNQDIEFKYRERSYWKCTRS